ncbi:MAG TPA: N-acetyltransferase [Actinoplanes sp.]|nr:N-acetyltransferase [Actinoplanes sp.]
MTELRPERAEDVAGIRAVHVAAFETPAEAGLVEALRASGAWLPGLSVVAAEDGAVVAHALLSRIVLAAAEGDVPGLALGPVAVLPKRQRQGYGSAVIREALAGRDDQLVVVLGDPAYYRRFGFVPAADFGVTGAYMSYREAWQVLPPSGGTKPGEVLYPDVWDEL